MHPVGRKIAAWTLSVLLAVGVLFSAWFLAAAPRVMEEIRRRRG